MNYTQPAIKASTYFMSTTHSLSPSLSLSLSLFLPRTLVSIYLSHTQTHISIYTFCELLRSKDMHGKKTTFCPELFFSLSPQAYYIECFLSRNYRHNYSFHLVLLPLFLTFEIRYYNANS